MFDIIPEAHRDAARSAVADALGPGSVEALRPVAGGASGALTYRVEAGGRAHLLRIETARDVFRNPERGYACMRSAADAGVAPPLRYADPASGVALMDFIDSRPLAQFPGGPCALAKALGELAARLQASGPFPVFAPYPFILEQVLGVVERARILGDGLLAPHREVFERIKAAYPWEAVVSSHNDPNPRNILFDGERLWLVDWELSYRADPMVDVAILADSFAPPGILEDHLLRAWSGREPDAALRARLALMRPLTRLYYGAVILSMFSVSPPETPDQDLSAPTVAEFTAAIAEGRLSPTGRDTLYVLAKMCLAGALEAARAPGFDEALKAASG